jgi:hypothetical protein
LEHIRQVVAEHHGGRADADLPRFAALQVAGNEIEVGEERLDKLEKLLAGGRQKP